MAFRLVSPRKAKAKSAPGSASTKPKPAPGSASTKPKPAPGSASNGHLSNRNLMQTLPPEIVLEIAKSAAHPYTVKSLSTAVTNSNAKKLLNNLYIERIKPATTALQRKHAVFKLQHPPKIIRTRYGHLVHRPNRSFVNMTPNDIWYMSHMGPRETPVWRENLKTGERIQYSGLHQQPYAKKQMRNHPETGVAKGTTTLYAPRNFRGGFFRQYGYDNNRVRVIYGNDGGTLFRVYKNGVNYLTRLQHKQHVPDGPDGPMPLMDVYPRPPPDGQITNELLSISVQPDGKLFFQVLDPRNGFKILPKPVVRYNSYNSNGRPSSSAKPSSVTLSDGTRVGLSYRNGMLVQATVKRNGDNSPLHSVGLVGKGSRLEVKRNGSTHRVPFAKVFSGRENNNSGNKSGRENNNSGRENKNGALLLPGFARFEQYFGRK